jgi:repressor LexA
MTPARTATPKPGTARARRPIALPAAGPDLTARQRRIVDFISETVRKRGYPPTVREIGEAVGLTSSSSVHAQLANLERRGLLRKDPTKPRAMSLSEPKLEGTLVPLLGRIAAGAPVMAAENVEEYLTVPLGYASGEDHFALRIVGDSMIGAGILEDDFVVVRPTKVADDGEIVVAMIGDEATVKSFYREPDVVRLEPANEAYEPIRTTDAELLGRVVGVFRKV